MKSIRLGILILILVLVEGRSVAQRVPFDKQLHFGAGFMVGSSVAMDCNVKRPFLNAVLFSTAAGAGKEAYDHLTGGEVEALDFAYTVAGGVLSGTVTYLLKKGITKRKKNREKWTYRRRYRH